MRNIKRIALLLSLVLLASMTGCARKSRRPALPAAPLQASLTAESADTGETASTDEMAPMMKSAAVSASRAVVMEEPVETLLVQFAEPLENEDALYQDYVQAHRSAYMKLRQRPEEVIPLILRSCCPTGRRSSATATTPRAQRFYTACSRISCRASPFRGTQTATAIYRTCWPNSSSL